MRRIAPLLALLIAISATADEYREILDEAVAAINWDFQTEWAFTEQSLHDEKQWVARYDPRNVEDDRWTLLTVDGHEPTAKEMREFYARKEDESREQSDDDNRISASIGDSDLELIEETDTHWSFAFRPDLGDDALSDAVDATVRIVRAGPHVETLEIRNREPIRPGFGTKLTSFLTRLGFAPAIEGGPIVPASIDVQVKGRAFLLIGFNEIEAVRYVDFEFAGE